MAVNGTEELEPKGSADAAASPPPFKGNRLMSKAEIEAENRTGALLGQVTENAVALPNLKITRSKDV